MFFCLVRDFPKNLSLMDLKLRLTVRVVTLVFRDIFRDIFVTTGT